MRRMYHVKVNIDRKRPLPRANKSKGCVHKSDIGRGHSWGYIAVARGGFLPTPEKNIRGCPFLYIEASPSLREDGCPVYIYIHLYIFIYPPPPDIWLSPCLPFCVRSSAAYLSTYLCSIYVQSKFYLSSYQHFRNSCV